MMSEDAWGKLGTVVGLVLLFSVGPKIKAMLFSPRPPTLVSSVTSNPLVGQWQDAHTRVTFRADGTGMEEAPQLRMVRTISQWSYANSRLTYTFRDNRDPAGVGPTTLSMHATVENNGQTLVLLPDAAAQLPREQWSLITQRYQRVQ